MKSIKTLTLVIVLLVSSYTSEAITNTAIAISGTNLVLSWPSYGYETYLVQYRQTLDSTDSWSVFTNAYPANSTNRTTFTIYGVVPLPAASGGNGSFASMATAANRLLSSEPMVIRTNGVGGAVPLALYPPGINLSGYVIFDPVTGESVNGTGYATSARSLSTPQFDGPNPLDNGGGPGPVQTGFYRVFHIPNFPAGITNYTFDGPTFIPVDFAAPDAPMDYVDGTTVLINGQPTDFAQFMSYVYGDGSTNWGVGIYFDRMPNGTNTIQLLTTVRESDTLNDQTPYMVFSNAPAAITVENFVTYTNWNDLILSNTYTFKAQSSVPNVDWEIDIYDVYDNFVNCQTGHSDDSNIAWTWDFMDYLGNPRNDPDNDPDFYPYITITGNFGSSAQNGGAVPQASGSNGGWMPPAAAQFPKIGRWLFAYMDNFYDDGTTNYAGADYYYMNGIESMEGGPWEWGIPAYDYPIKFGTNYTRAQRDASWEELKTIYLQSRTIRNFYYYGHGTADSIGGDINALDSSNNIIGAKHLPGSNAYLSDLWVLGNVLVNKAYGSIPFRFIFLDGCNTASGSWPVDWGVPKQTETVDFYRSNTNRIGNRPNAFVGWDTSPGGAGWGTVQGAWAFRQNWMAQWAGTFQRQLNDAFDIANSVSGWVDNAHYAHLKKYGYITMMFQEYNHAGDWP